jgi:hypothetical protein
VDNAYKWDALWLCNKKLSYDLILMLVYKFIGRFILCLIL